MDPDFWQQRWQQELIGFHQAETNRYLQKYLDGLNLQTGDTVFVPLCGKSLDMWWLHDRGYRVLGVELSAIACQAFFTEAGRHACEKKDGLFGSWKSSDVEILCGDFFDLSPELLPNVRAVYDRAALIALPEDMRRQYVDHLASLLPSDTTGLLITMEYPQKEMQGPPFSVSENEIKELFASKFEIELLEDVDVLAANARFRERGLSDMHEKIYRYKRC